MGIFSCILHRRILGTLAGRHKNSRAAISSAFAAGRRLCEGKVWLVSGPPRPPRPSRPRRPVSCRLPVNRRDCPGDRCRYLVPGDDTQGVLAGHTTWFFVTNWCTIPGSPCQTHPVEVAGNSPVYSQGCKSPFPVAEGAAGKPGCNTAGRKPYFKYSSQGCMRTGLHSGHHQPPLRRMDHGLRVGEAGRSAAGPSHPPRPHPGDERRQLPPPPQPAERRLPGLGRAGRLLTHSRPADPCS